MQWLDALAELKLPPLVSSNHARPALGLCAMEMVAYMERLDHTDSPECTCEIIRQYTIGINDTLSDQERQKLLPVLPELVDTVVETKFREKRFHFLIDSAMRDFEHFRDQQNLGRDMMEYYRQRGMPNHHKLEEMLQYAQRRDISSAVMLPKFIYPMHRLADIYIGTLRGALAIGPNEPRREFNHPEQVHHLSKIEYVKATDDDVVAVKHMPSKLIEKYAQVQAIPYQKIFAAPTT